MTECNAVMRLQPRSLELFVSMHLFLLVLGWALGLCSTAELLGAVLSLLAYIPSCQRTFPLPMSRIRERPHRDSSWEYYYGRVSMAFVGCTYAVVC